MARAVAISSDPSICNITSNKRSVTETAILSTFVENI
jgi:hypothetical protein